MKVSLGGSLGWESTRVQEQCFNVPIASECKKFKWIQAVNVRVSPPPITCSVLTAQTRLTFVELCQPPKILGQKGRSNHSGDSPRATKKSYFNVYISEVFHIPLFDFI